jgi:hypothetical protein
MYVDYITERVDKAINEISSQPGVRTALNTYDTTMVEKSKENYKSFIKRNFDDLEDNYPFIEQSFLITFESNKVFTNKNTYELDIDKLNKSNVFDKVQKSEKDIYWANIVESNIFKSSSNKNMLITFQKVFHSQNEAQQIGFTLTIIDIAMFNSFYVDKILDKDGKVQIVDNTGTIEINNFSKEIKTNVSNLKYSTTQDNSLKKIVLNNSSYYYTLLPLSHINFSLLYIIPEDNLISSPAVDILKSSMYYILFLSLLICIILIIVILIFYKLLLNKDKLDYKLLLTEDLNGKLRLYRHDFANHLQIINGLLELNRIDNARAYIKRTADEGMSIQDVCPIGIPELESLILASLKSAKENNIEFDIQCIEIKPEDLPIKVYDLSKILSNLLKNAIYALQKFDGYNKQLSLRIFKDSDCYIFEIINSNPIIPIEIREKIFEKHYTTKGSEGTGLGLFIVDTLVKKYNGTLTLVVDDFGNHFIVKL